MYSKSQSAPDFIQIGSLSAELQPNAWTPSKLAVKWIHYVLGWILIFQPNNNDLCAAGCSLSPAVVDTHMAIADWFSLYSQSDSTDCLSLYNFWPIINDFSMNEWMNENARILSAFENRLRAGFV